MLNNRDISDKHMITLRNKFNALQEISETVTQNDKYKKLRQCSHRRGSSMHTNQTESKT